IVADDPVAFAAGITRLLTDRDLWHRLAASGRETIRSAHSHAVARERLVAALEAVRTSPRRSRPRLPVETAARGVEPAACPFHGLAEEHRVTRPSVRAGQPAPSISIVIPTRDRAALLREALESLAAQSTGAEAFEVVVVNDGSTDATADVCGEFAGRLRLTRVDTPAAGIGRAKNVGIDVAAAPLLLFFDDDDAADPGLVAAHLAAHGRYPLEHVSVLGYTDWHERLVKTEVMRFVTDVGHYLFSYTFLRDGQVLDHTWFWGGRSSCKKSLLVRAGGFRPEFTFGSEDIEAGYRISSMVDRERREAGFDGDGAGLAVVFCRDAVQHVIRPVTYDEFCRRCERQGRSQRQFSRFYDDPAVRDWCRVDGAAQRWDEARDLLAARVARVHELEPLLAAAAAADRGPLRDELHALYRWTFDAFKAKGIVEEAGDRG
ncbi:MAG: glycosyltransferase, partial [Planctomycetia bacterium]|nr:glycosyltransferase [Planctomycetia bacterium]